MRQAAIDDPVESIARANARCFPTLSGDACEMREVHTPRHNATSTARTPRRMRSSRGTVGPTSASCSACGSELHPKFETCSRSPVADAGRAGGMAIDG